MSTSPDGLGPRGSALWESLARSPETPDGVLALEACRAADRLDELDSIIHGKGVLHLMQFRLKDLFSPDDERRVSVEVKFDSVLSEARQQQGVLRQMLVSLGLQSAPASESAAPASTVDEFTKRRQERKAK